MLDAQFLHGGSEAVDFRRPLGTYVIRQRSFQLDPVPRNGTDARQEAHDMRRANETLSRQHQVAIQKADQRTRWRIAFHQPNPLAGLQRERSGECQGALAALSGSPHHSEPRLGSDRVTSVDGDEAGAEGPLRLAILGLVAVHVRQRMRNE